MGWVARWGTMTAMGSARAGDGRRDRLWALGIGGLCFFVYLATLCRSLYWYDSAEYVTAAVTLGIPHPPGYPLYTLIAHVFTWLPVSPPTAVSAMSAFFAALAVGFTFLLVRLLGGGRLAALVGAASLGFGNLFWSQAIICEVYTPGIAFLLAVLLLVLRGLQQNRARPIILGAALAGLGLGVHLSLATCGLGLALLVWSLGLEIENPRQLRALWSGTQLRRRISVSVGALLAALGGSLIFLYLPIRASMKPVLNFGDPSTWDRFIWHITGGNYKHWFTDDIDFGARASRIAGSFYDQLLVVGLVLALVGLVSLFRRRPAVAVALLLMMAGNVYFFFDYRVHDLEVFFLPTTAVLCCAIGLGAEAVLSFVDSVVRAERGPGIRRLVAAVLCAFPLSLLLMNYQSVDMSDFSEAEEFGDALVAQLPPDAVILNYTTPPEWKRDAVFGFYYQKVLDARPDVRILVAPQAAKIGQLLRERVPVFLYAPIPEITRHLVVVEDGVMFRVLGFRRTRPPEQRAQPGSGGKGP